MTKIFAKQFIRGKISSPDRQNYDIVAKSRNIDDSEIQNVVQAFSGSQPLATEIPNYKGAWLVSSIDSEQVALVRQERSLEKEFGGQYFLYEHYKVFNKKVLKRSHRIWLFTLESYQQKVFRSFTYLDNQIEIDNDFLLKVISSTLVNLFMSNTEGLGGSAVQHLYTLLNKRKLKVQGAAVDVNKMLAALSLILPSSQLNDYKAYFGKDLPYSWSWDIAFLADSSWGDSNSLAVEKILSNRINESYTKIIYKILGSNQNNWPDFPDCLDNIEPETIRNQNDVEMVLGKALFHEVGLRLIRVNIKLQRANTEDVHIAWRELSDQTDAKDVETILPAILEDESNWDEKDYAALGKNVLRHGNVVSNCLSNLFVNNPEKFAIFLESWLSKQPSQKELDFIAHMLFDFGFQNVPVLFRIVEKKEDLDLELLILLFDQKNINDLDVTTLISTILRKAKTKRQITDFFSVLKNDIHNQLLRLTVSFLVSAVSDDHVLSFKKEFAIIYANLNAMPIESRRIFCASLLEFAINLQIEIILNMLLLKNQTSCEFISLIDTSKIRDLEMWAANSRSKVVSAAYIIVLYQINKGQQAMDYLAQIISKDARAYEAIFSVFQKMPNPGKYTAISLNKLTDLDFEVRTKILIQYIKTTKLLSSDEKAYFMDFLKKIPYSPLVINLLEDVYDIFLKTEDIDVCQLILELQIKDAILRKNDVEFEEKMNSLERLAPPQKILRNRIVVDYLNVISNSSEKHGFLTNLLLEPSSNLNDPKILKKALATSLILRDNFREIFEDINCLLIIYRWAYQECSVSRKV